MISKLRILAFDERPHPSHADPREDEWVKGQFVYHLSRYEKTTDIQEAARCLEAVVELGDELCERAGRLVLPPVRVRQMLVHRFRAQGDTASKKLLILSMMRLLYIPEVKELFYELLENRAQEPELAAGALRSASAVKIMHALGHDETEIIRFTELLLPIVSSESLARHVCGILHELLGEPYVPPSGILPPQSTADAFVNRLREILRSRVWRKRLRALSRYQATPAGYYARDILVLIGIEDGPSLSEMSPHESGIRRTTAFFKPIRVQRRLTDSEMGQLATHIQKSPLPYGLLEDFFSRERTKVLFVSRSGAVGHYYYITNICQEAIRLRETVGLTHVAIPIPATQKDSFEKFLRREPASPFIHAYAEYEGLDLGSPELVEKLTDFRDAMLNLRSAGVDIFLFGAEPHLKKDLAFDSEVQAFCNLLETNRNAVVLVYSYYTMPVSSCVGLHLRSGEICPSLAQALAERLPRGAGVASVIEQDADSWEYESMIPRFRIHNLGDFLDRYPHAVTRSFGLRLGETALAKLPFDMEFGDTYGVAFDGVVFRHKGDEGRGVDPVTPTPPAESVPDPVVFPVFFPRIRDMDFGTVPIFRSSVVTISPPRLGVMLRHQRLGLTQI